MSAVLLALLACDVGPTFEEVQKIDTIAAYEEFLARDPDSIYQYAINKRLEELYYDQALREGSLAAWKAYLDKFPESPRKASAQKEAAFAAYSEAMKVGTPDALRAFVKEWPKADKWLLARAEGRAAVLEYGKLEVGEPKVAEVNMADDPKGELNGWGISAEVTNAGDQTLAYVSLTLEYLADDGHVLAVKDYPLVSPTWNLPASEEQTRPLEPGGKRTWLWTESKETVPKDWHQKVRLVPTGLKPVQ